MVELWTPNHWIIMAWIAPSAWALSSLIEVSLISRDAFRTDRDATVVTGFLSILPCLAIAALASPPLEIEPRSCLLALTAGLAYLGHLFFYFKALFTLNDAAHADAFLNFSVVLVPLMSFLVVGEELRDVHYGGITLAALGVLVINLNDRRAGGTKPCPTPPLILSVIFLSVSCVLQDQTFLLVDYWTGSFWYGLGVISGLVALSLRSSFHGLRRTLTQYPVGLGLSQFLTGLGVMASLRATDLSPSVSLVVLIECAAPILLMFFSLSALWLLKGPLAKSTNLRNTLRLQLRQTPAKLVSCGLILAGIGLISLAGAR